MARLFETIIATAAFLAGGVSAALAETASAWSEGYNSKARLLAGTAKRPGGPDRMIAGIEIGMADGWKTYWRNPGDAGGVPPYFDWAGSENVAAVRVFYPAPSRMKDASGESIGYKKAVVLPVEVTAKDAAKPVVLKVALEYGVCREICVPAEAKLSLEIAAGTTPLPAPLATSLDLVPRKSTERRAADPELKAVRAMLSGDAPRLEFDAVFAGDGAGADAFVEAPEGIYLNLPKKLKDGAAGLKTFEVDLATGVDVAELKGKTLTFTLVAAGGQSEATWKID